MGCLYQRQPLDRERDLKTGRSLSRDSYPHDTLLPVLASSSSAHGYKLAATWSLHSVFVPSSRCRSTRHGHDTVRKQTSCSGSASATLHLWGKGKAPAGRLGVSAFFSILNRILLLLYTNHLHSYWFECQTIASRNQTIITTEPIDTSTTSTHLVLLSTSLPTEPPYTTLPLSSPRHRSPPTPTPTPTPSPTQIPKGIVAYQKAFLPPDLSSKSSRIEWGWVVYRLMEGRR